MSVILHLHEMYLRAKDQPLNLKFLLYQGDDKSTRLESRKQIVLVNDKVVIEEGFQFDIQKGERILIIILKQKGLETAFLGQISIDLNKYKNMEMINMEMGIGKCEEKDEKAKVIISLMFGKKKQLREFEVQRAINKQEKSKEKRPSVITSTESIASKSQSQSKMNQDRTRKVSTEFYKRNYKNLEILRQDKKEPSEKNSHSKERSGSYKKRFQYQAQQAANKNKNTIVFMKQKKQKKKVKIQQQVPVARNKTPQPIKFERNSYTSQSKSKHISKQNSANRPRQATATQKSNQKHNRTVTSIHAKTQQFQTQSEPMIDLSKASSNKSLVQQDKYSILINKLKFIDTKIQDKKSIQQSSQKQSKDEQDQDNRDSICTFGDAIRLSNQDAPIAPYVKIIQLQQKIVKLQQKIIKQQKQKHDKQMLIQKLTTRYDKIIQEIEKCKWDRDKQVTQLKQQLNKFLKNGNNEVSEDSQLKNQKRKIISLQNTLILKQNEIKHLKLSIDLLQKQNKQIDVLLSKKESRIGQKSSRALLEAQMMSRGYPSAVRSQNQLLRSQNQLLKIHIQQLNQLIKQYQLHNSPIINQLKSKQISDLKSMIQLLNKNIKVQQTISHELQVDLRKSKLNFAALMNVIFEKGGEQLIEIIEKQIIQQSQQHDFH